VPASLSWLATLAFIGGSDAKVPAADAQVAIEFHVVTIADDFLERIAVHCEEQATGATATPAPSSLALQHIAVLDPNQFRRLLLAVQGDTRTNIVQAPALLAVNGRTATADVSERRLLVAPFRGCDRVVDLGIDTGFRVRVKPLIAADGRSVLLELKATLEDVSIATPLSPVGIRDGDMEAKSKRPVTAEGLRRTTMKLDTAFRVETGKTAVLHWGSRVVENRRESDLSVPILCEIPCLGELFKVRCVDRAREGQRVLLVTPRAVDGLPGKAPATAASRSRPQ